MKNKIIVCIPCYNCKNQILRVISDFNKSLLEKIEKVILIDNRSTDYMNLASVFVFYLLYLI